MRKNVHLWGMKFWEMKSLRKDAGTGWWPQMQYRIGMKSLGKGSRCGSL